MKKIKYLDRESQIAHVYTQLCKIFTKENHERNCVIDFLVHDYRLSDGAGGFIDMNSTGVLASDRQLKHAVTTVGAGLMGTQTSRKFSGDDDDDLFRMDTPPNNSDMPFASLMTGESETDPLRSLNLNNQKSSVDSMKMDFEDGADHGS